MADLSPTGGEARADAPGGGGAEHTWGHTIPFGDEYFERIQPPLEAILAEETPSIADLAGRIKTVLARGGNVWYQAKQGHMPRFELDMANRGNPGILQSNTEWDDTDYDRMRPGDILVTNYVNEPVMRAKQDGVYIVEVTVCYQDSPRHPRGYVVPNPLALTQADLADMMIDSHAPYEQGLVRCPEIPEMKICPSSGTLLTAVFWAVQAEAAARVKDAGAPAGAFARAYLETVLARIREAYPAGRDAILDAAAAVAKKIGAGAHYHVTSNHGGVECEATGTAMGPMMTNAFKKAQRPGDVHLLATIEPDGAAILSAAQAAREGGQFLVGVGPAGSARLRGLCDVFFDNRCDEGGGLLEIPGWSGRVAAAGGIVNNVLAWCFTAQFVDEMVRRGWVPWFWMGYYRAGGAEYNEAVRPLFLAQGF